MFQIGYKITPWNLEIPMICGCHFLHKPDKPIRPSNPVPRFTSGCKSITWAGYDYHYRLLSCDRVLSMWTKQQAKYELWCSFFFMFESILFLVSILYTSSHWISSSSLLIIWLQNPCIQLVNNAKLFRKIGSLFRQCNSLPMILIGCSALYFL